MPRNRLIGSKQAEFTPNDGGAAIVLHRNVTSGTHTLKPRLAIHEYLKRDGAEVEWMGNSPNRYTYSLVFVGSDWRAQYVAVAARLQTQPKGILVDPVFGRVKVACEGIDGASWDVGQATNAITVPIAFTSDEVDPQSFQAEQTASVNVKASDITDAIDDFETQVAALRNTGFQPSAATVTSLALVSSTGAAYAEAASDASNDNIADPSLDTKLSAVEASTSATITMLEAEGTDLPNAELFPVVNGCEQVYARCLELSDAVSAARPVVISYTVPGDTGIIALCARLYGSQADDQIEQVLVLNRIPNPALIPGGTVLRLPSPTNV